MLLEGQQLGRYHLLRLLGRGAMGEVYLAEDRGINRQVAIKVIRTEVSLHPDTDEAREATNLFQREMKTIARLNHPQILPLFDYGEQVIDGATLTYMVMPFCPEGSLGAWLLQHSTSALLSPQDVAHIVLQAADALQHAHDQGIIHRDVKPSNFLIRSNREYPSRPNLLLADFGLAKLNTGSTSHTIRGTPLYMAPEQWRGHPVPATDQYALAAMAYELLTGRPPFKGSLEQLMYQHSEGQPEPPSRLNPQLSAAMDAVLLRALAKNPEDRFPSIFAFARAFQLATQGSESKSADLYATLGTSSMATSVAQELVTSTGMEGAHSDSTFRAGDQDELANRSKPARGLKFTIGTRKRGISCSLVLLAGLLLIVVGVNTLRNLSFGRSTSGITGGGSANTPISSSGTPPPPGATATVSSGNPNPNPYGGTLVLNDPLSDNSKGYNWDEQATSFGTCSFVGGAYQVAATQVSNYHRCAAQNPHFSNFAFEVNMTITQGDCGGMIFRADVANYKYYYLLVCQDGSYQLSLYTQQGPPTKTLVSGTSRYIQKGLGQANLIAVVANNNMINLYVNHQLAGSVTDGTYSQGQIGFVAEADTGPTEVMFRNTRVWTL